MKLPRGLKILEDREGSGPAARSGDRITYNVRIFLNKGDEVPLNEHFIGLHDCEEPTRRDGDHLLCDFYAKLGAREAFAGIDKALIGMRPGGFRKLRVSPHLAYRDRGVQGFIPPDAVLYVSVWLREIRPSSGRREPDR